MAKDRNFIAVLKLSEPSRDWLLGNFPAIYPNVYCRYITLAYNVPNGFNMPRGYIPVKVHGVAIRQGTQALLCEVARTFKRADGKPFHITISVDDGVPPAEAGRFDITDVTMLAGVVEFDTEPKLIPRQVMPPERPTIEDRIEKVLQRCGDAAQELLARYRAEQGNPVELLHKVNLLHAA